MVALWGGIGATTEALRVKITFAVLVFVWLPLASCRGGEEKMAPAAAANRNTAAVIDATSRRPCVNLNQATAEELMRLPGVGEVMSRRIIDYRERHGPFRRPAEIIIIEGFSEKKYRALEDLICVGPPVSSDE